MMLWHDLNIFSQAETAETQLCFASRDITAIADLSAWLWHHSSGLEKPEVNTGKLQQTYRGQLLIHTKNSGGIKQD